MRCCSNLGGIVSAALTLLVTVASDTAVGRPLPFQHVIASLAVEPIKPRGKLKPRARVQFHALTKGKKGLVAYALTDIVDSGRKYKGHPVFEATIVAPQDLQAKIDYNSPDPLDWLVPFQHRKSLLCVHGFNTQPENWFKECAKYSANGNYTVVPVVWPGELNAQYPGTLCPQAYI